MTIQALGKKSGVFNEVETNTLAHRFVMRPRDFQMRGAYQAAANGTNFCFFNTSSYGNGPYCLIKKWVLSSGVAASAAGNVASINFSEQRNYTTTAVALIAAFCKLRSSFPLPVGCVSITTNSGTADAQKLWSSTISIPATAGSKTHPPFDALDGSYLVVEPGTDIRVTPVFSTNVTFSHTVYWEEYDLIN